jgi:hypothetical protein
MVIRDDRVGWQSRGCRSPLPPPPSWPIQTSAGKGENLQAQATASWWGRAPPLHVQPGCSPSVGALLLTDLLRLLWGSSQLESARLGAALLPSVTCMKGASPRSHRAKRSWSEQCLSWLEAVLEVPLQGWVASRGGGRYLVKSSSQAGLGGTGSPTPSFHLGL